MGRVEKRKQAKNDRKNKINKIEESLKETTIEDTIMTFIKIVIVIGLLILALYFVLAKFVTKEFDGAKDNNTENNSEEKTPESVENKILAKNIFNQQESTYYVYFYDFNDENEELKNNISSLEEKIYRVDTSSGLNSNYITSEPSGNKGAKKIEDLKVINPTLIKISNDTIIEYYENIDNIVNYINK